MPAYIDTTRAGRLAERVAAATAALRDCRLCPRACRVDRTAGELGRCAIGRRAVVADAGPHHGEEAVLTGDAGGALASFQHGGGGSGTVFFSGCALGCTFCQNWEISHERRGRPVDSEELAAVMLDLQGRGCHNLNLVTPSHVAAQVLEALPAAVEGGLRLPIVYNTSGYDAVETLRLLDGVVDIYMPDFKYWTEKSSATYLCAGDYPDRARAAIAEMHRQVGDLRIDGDGIARRGLLVRHLVMPGAADESEAIFAWLAELSRDTYVNVMGQYGPAGAAARDAARAPAGGRRLEGDEHAAALAAARRAGLRRAVRA
jgi:putative pyruvate formate lyase activating enzyme